MKPEQEEEHGKPDETQWVFQATEKQPKIWHFTQVWCLLGRLWLPGWWSAPSNWTDQVGNVIPWMCSPDGNHLQITFTFPSLAATPPSGHDLAAVPCSDLTRRCGSMIPAARCPQAQLCRCLMCPRVGQALSLDGDVKIIVCHLKVPLLLWRGSSTRCAFRDQCTVFGHFSSVPGWHLSSRKTI